MNNLITHFKASFFVLPGPYLIKFCPDLDADVTIVLYCFLMAVKIIFDVKQKKVKL